LTIISIHLTSAGGVMHKFQNRQYVYFHQHGEPSYGIMSSNK
jgi:hypothetical protein